MKSKIVSPMSLNTRVLRIFLVTGLILLVPFVAMQLTDDVNWSLTDFVIIGILLLVAGSIYELVASKLKEPIHRAILAVAVAAIVFLIWAELAVGIFGTPFAGS